MTKIPENEKIMHLLRPVIQTCEIKK